MDIDTFREWLDTLLPQIENALTRLAQPWHLYQIGALIVCFVVAHFAARRLESRLTDWMRSRENMPKARIRFLLVLVRRIRPILFVLLAWLTVLAIRAVTPWPSRSYLIATVALLATAWVVVGIATRLIRNRLLRSLFTWTAWIIVTIHILNFDEEVYAFLDSTALSFGEMRLSLLLLLQSIATLTLLIMAARWISAMATRRIESVEDMSPAMKVLTEKLMRLIVYGAAIIFALEAVGFDMTNFAVLSGAVGLGIGFGLQKVVSNLVSGVILLLDKSIKPGDVISLGETFGWISSLGARYVSVLTRDGREYLIPNEDLITGQVVNWSHSSDLVRLDVYFGVAYASNPHDVRRIAREAAGAVNRVSDQPAPVCHIVGFGDSSIDFILRFWIRDPTKGLTNIRGDVFLALWDALKANDIEIPFPRRDVTILGGTKPAALQD